MNCTASPTFGKEQATKLLNSGWRQCQVFAPSDLVGSSDIAEGDYWIVCTQSCSVVSECLIRDPFVEVAIARPVAKYREKSSEARGKNVRKLHLPVDGASFQALEIDINTRRFIKRDLLLRITPASICVSNKARRDFAGWISRYNSRIALPNELVSRLRLTIFKDLEDFFTKKLEEVSSAKSHEEIASMWIKFEPDHELGIGDEYTVELMMLCDDERTAEALDRALMHHGIFREHTFKSDGVYFTFEVRPATEVFLSDLNGWHRFTDWDYLSGMADVVTIPTSV